MTDKQREESAAFHLRKVKRVHEDFQSALADLEEVMEISIPEDIDFAFAENPEHLRHMLARRGAL